tara:strand:- start:5248 stop:5826 length:579 start_codon:yes stop_codon:yes gene_type:complete
MEEEENDIDAVSDLPVPGQSLTGKLGEKAYERPPEKPTVEENLSYYADAILNEELMPKLASLLDGGRKVSDLAEATITSGVASGRHTIDVGVLVLPSVMQMMVYVGELYDVDYDIGLDVGSDKSKDHFIAAAAKKIKREDAAAEGAEDETTRAFMSEQDESMPEDISENIDIEPEVAVDPSAPATGLMGKRV